MDLFFVFTFTRLWTLPNMEEGAQLLHRIILAVGIAWIVTAEILICLSTKTASIGYLFVICVLNRQQIWSLIWLFFPAKRGSFCLNVSLSCRHEGSLSLKFGQLFSGTLFLYIWSSLQGHLKNTETNRGKIIFLGKPVVCCLTETFYIDLNLLMCSNPQRRRID